MKFPGATPYETLGSSQVTRKGCQHILIERLLERHDDVGKLAWIDPAPRPELLVRSGDIDILVLAEEAEQEPALGLAAIFALPHLTDQIVGQVIAELFGRPGDELDLVGGDPGLLAQFADRGGLGILAGIDPALRHLPGLERGIEPLADEHEPRA